MWDRAYGNNLYVLFFLPFWKKWLKNYWHFVTGATGWYFWSSYHPYINIQVSEGTAGDNLKVAAPYIAYSEKNGVPMAASINLKISDLTMQHEFMCKSIRENYICSDIKLKINKKKDKTILKYYGTATSLDGKVEDFNKQITVDYILNADIKYQWLNTNYVISMF